MAINDAENLENGTGLTGEENYSLWSKYVRIALLGRNKLGFVDGSWKKENFKEELWYQWKRCNAIVQSWIMNIVSSNLLGGTVYADSAQDVWEDLKERFNKVNGSRSFSLHQEIVRLTQGTTSVATYFPKLKELWVELEARIQILLMTPLPLVNQAYAMIVSDEAQKAMGAASNSVGLLGTMPNLDPTAMYSKTGYQNQRFRKTSNLYSDHCKMRNHIKENCYKVKGYLQDSRFKRKGGSGGSSAAYNVLSQEENDQMTQLDNQGNNKASKIHYIDTPSQVTQVLGKITQTGVCAFTQSQYDQIVQMLNQSHQQSTNSHTSSSANVAGTEPGICSSKVIASLLKSTNGKNVQLPNGEVSKDLYNGKVKEIGKEDDGLYLLLNKSTGKLGGTQLNAHEVTVVSIEEIKLWHMRFGYVASTTLNKVLPASSQNIAETDKLQPRTRTSVLMGYLEVEKGYIMYDITNKYFIVNGDASFREYYDKRVSIFSSVTEPQSYTEAAQDPSWIEAMQEEIKALQKNNTWEIVNLPEGKKPIGCKWIYKVKYKATSEVERLKARLIAKDYSQQEGIDYQETFSPVVKMAPRQWNAKLIEALLRFQFVKSKFDHSLIIKRTDRGTIVVLIYVDDMLITGDNLELIQDTKAALQKSFKIKDLGELKYILGIEFARSENGISVHQRKYALELIYELGLSAAKPIGTPMDSNSKLITKEYDEHLSTVSITKDEVISDIGSYQRLIGKLLYLTVTRPDIAFSVQNLSQFLQQPKRSHMKAAHRIVKYIKNEPGLGVLLSNKSQDNITTFCDTNWAACPQIRKSVTGFLVKIEDSTVLEIKETNYNFKEFY
ncbi:uncharacterized protein LOC142180699 [Nicotiana tabacum]|uniref:Uncharacterized protein LOC142180699 n=1 Tax=Nicotiana tabacum TaxID=4097 RepID=A0AC58UH86_TOBAC